MHASSGSSLAFVQLEWTEIGIATFVGLILTALDAYCIIRAITKGHGVNGTLAWVLAILAIPPFGAVAYLLLANPRIKRTTRRKRAQAARVKPAIRNHPGHDRNPEAVDAAVDAVAASEGADRASAEWPLFKLATRLTGLPPTTGNEVELLAEDATAFDRMESAMNDAQKSIWAEYYIIRRDETGARFLDILCDRAKAGVEVRLIYDSVGSFSIDTNRLSRIRAAGGHVAEFLPANPLRRRWAIHLRNHRKVIVIDGTAGFVGGMNVGDEYSGLARRRGAAYYYRDTHLSVRGPAVAGLAQTFAEDWAFAADRDPEVQGDQILEPPPPPPPLEGATVKVAIVPSGPDQLHNASGAVYLRGLGAAQSRIFLSSPYFVPDEAILRTLINAGLAGVDVRVLLPKECDVRIVGLAARFYYDRLIEAGVRVFEYQPSMHHAKTVVVDGAWGIVGSANIDVRSFRLNFEIGALVASTEFAKGMEDRFLEDLDKSVEITRAILKTRSRGARLVYGAARLLAPLL